MKLLNKSFVLCGLLTWTVGSYAQTLLSTPQSQMEKLDRGLVVFPTTKDKVFVSWRLLGTEAQAPDPLNNYAPVTFDLLKMASLSPRISQEPHR